MRPWGSIPSIEKKRKRKKKKESKKDLGN
jgi:hypothetical protein